MRGTPAATCFWLALVLCTGPASAQDVMVDEAVAVLESEQFLASLAGCFPASDRPAEVTLTTRVSGEGVASLTQITPMLLTETSTCLAQAVAGLQFPQSAWGIEITFAVPVADLPAPSPAPAPPLVDPAAMPPTAAVYYVAPQPVPQPAADWKRLHDSGKRKVRAGAVLVGIGGTLFLSGIIMAVAMNQSSSLDLTITLTAPMALSLVGGLGMLVPGSIVLGIGRRRLRQAEQMRGALSGLLPLPSFAPLDGGGALLLTWTF
ncbi:MAG: hypothetical protein JRG91_04980 [Deltaproteobacteria bacterium]|nr:hypothetical protein [Deltaproteobacteria bacterium]